MLLFLPPPSFHVTTARNTERHPEKRGQSFKETPVCFVQRAWMGGKVLVSGGGGRQMCAHVTGCELLFVNSTILYVL